MSFKGRIYTIVAVLIFVAIVIGGVAYYALNRIHQAIELETEFASKVSTIKDLRSEMQNVLISVREIVLNDNPEQMKQEKAAIDKLVAEKIDPGLAAFEVMPKDQGSWRELQALWTKHKDIVNRIYTNTYANTDVIAMNITMNGSVNYWNAFDEPIRQLVAEARNLNSKEGTDVAFNALEALEAIQSVQMREKLAVMAPVDARRQQEDAIARKGIERVNARLDAVERALTNPKVGDAELRAFNASFADAAKDRLQFALDGGVTIRQISAAAPGNFVNPDMQSISRLYWDRIKPMRGSGIAMLNKALETAAMDSNGIAFHILRDECNPTRNAETRIIGDLVASGEGRAQGRHGGREQGIRLGVDDPVDRGRRRHPDRPGDFHRLRVPHRQGPGPRHHQPQRTLQRRQSHCRSARLRLRVPGRGRQRTGRLP